jgi:hypothetical protein
MAAAKSGCFGSRQHLGCATMIESTTGEEVEYLEDELRDGSKDNRENFRA